MDAVTLSQLRKPRPFPAVSVLMPTYRRAPQNFQDPIRLRNLLTEVRRRLREDDRISAGTADAVVKGLEEAADEIDFGHAEDGLVLFAAPDGEHHVFKVAQPVEERVVVDTTFATRDLVAAFTRTTRYWLLVLSDQQTRLWDGEAERLTEVTEAGFPLSHVLPDGADERPGKLSRPPREQADERRRQFFREVIDSLTAVMSRERRPLIVAGTTRDQAYFDDTAGQSVSVAGWIDGAHEARTPHELTELAKPALDAYEDLREVALLAELEAARNARRYATGLEQVVDLVAEGRGAHLIVERGYYAPAVWSEEGVIPVEGPPGSLRGGDVVDDAVDNVIETALDYGGEVTFVSDGFLVDHERIALVTRY